MTLLLEQHEHVLIDARNMYYKILNAHIQEMVNNGAECIEAMHVNGQRYIGNGINKKIRIKIHGTPGNNLASFMNGPEITLYGNAQEQVANTMNDGKLVIHGNAGDVVGYGMRGGKVFVRGDVGYRVGIHMKEFRNQVPVIVIGGSSGDFLGEYMAGGIIVALGLNCMQPDNLVGEWCGTGMHGGMIITRNFEIPSYKLGREPMKVELNEHDMIILKGLIQEYSTDFNLNADEILAAQFYKYVPLTHRPYGKLYAPQP